MKHQTAGFSLVQTLVALGLVGGVTLAAMKVQELSTKSQIKTTSDQNVELTTLMLQKALADRSVCTMNFKNKTIGTQIISIMNASPSPTDYDTILATGETIVAKDMILPGEIAVTGMSLVTSGTNDYLSVDYNLDPKNKKKMAGAKHIKKMIPLITNKVAGMITSCTSETDNLLYTTAIETCRALKGTYINGKCNFIDQYLDFTPKNCGGGASYQMAVVAGKITMTCSPCPTLVKVFQYSRNEKRVRGSKSEKFCYYYSACSDNPTKTFGLIFSEKC